MQEMPGSMLGQWLGTIEGNGPPVASGSAVAEPPPRENAQPAPEGAEPGAQGEGQGEESPTTPLAQPEAAEPLFDTLGNLVSDGTAAPTEDETPPPSSPPPAGTTEAINKARRGWERDLDAAMSGDRDAYQRLNNTGKKIVQRARSGTVNTVLNFFDEPSPDVLAEEERSFQLHDEMMGISINDPDLYARMKYSQDVREAQKVLDFENFLNWKVAGGLGIGDPSAKVRKAWNDERNRQRAVKLQAVMSELEPATKLESLKDTEGAKLLTDDDWDAIEAVETANEDKPPWTIAGLMEREFGRRMLAAERRSANAPLRARAASQQRTAQTAQRTQGIPTVTTEGQPKFRTFRDMQAENIQRRREGRIDPEWDIAYARAEQAWERQREQRPPRMPFPR